MKTAKKDKPKNIVFVLYDGVTMVDFIGATEVFNNVPGFEIHWAAPSMNPIITSEKMRILPTCTFADAPGKAEILFVPGGFYDGVTHAMFSKDYRSFIHRLSKHASWTGSVCTGAFIVAAAGVMNDCLVTTYWSQLNNLALLNEKYNFTVVPGYPRFLLDEKKKRFTGGGISSSLDLALRLTEEIAGKKAAETAQLMIQYAPGPPVHAGDPTEASPELSAGVMKAMADYTAEMRKSALRLLAEKNGKHSSSKK